MLWYYGAKKKFEAARWSTGLFNLVFSLCNVFIRVVEYIRVSESHCNLKRFEVRS